jgi:hypothetical protein
MEECAKQSRTLSISSLFGHSLLEVTRLSYCLCSMTKTAAAIAAAA